MIEEKNSPSENSNENNIIPNLKYKTNSFNTLKKNVNQNNNNSTIGQTEPNQIKTYYNKNINLTEENKNKEHPLLFYTLGKVNNYKIYNSNIPLYTSQGFRSSSNDMMKRNLLSINTSYYDELKKKKGNSTIRQQIIEENDYLNPLKIYKSFHKYDVSNNCINQETYNLAKKKMYSKDIISNIKKGLYITKKEFIEQKKKILDDNKSKSIDLKEKNSDLHLRKSLDNDKIKNGQMNKTINTETNINKYIFKDPNDYTREDLIGKNWRFDRNNKIFIKHKNWWKIDKYVIIYY